MASPDLIAAYCTGAAGIITAIGGVLVGVLGSRRAKQAAADAVIPVMRKVDDVGKQVGQHNYEVRDRLNTEALRGETMQRGIESLVTAKENKPSEQSVWNYIREAKKSQSEAQIAAAQAQHALEQVQMLLGQTPTAKVTVYPVAGPPPPPVPPLKGEG
jgi:phosphopantetheine adenylyltransferase